MHPFSSHLDCLYNIIHFENGTGVKIEPRNPSSWYKMCLFLSFAMIIFAIIIITSTDVGDLVGWLCMCPGTGLLVYTVLKKSHIFWTYGSQEINSITISDGTILIEILGKSKGGLLRGYTKFLGRPMREKVVDSFTIPLSAIRGYLDCTVRANDEVFYLFKISFVEIGDAFEEKEVVFPITPRFLKLQDAIHCLMILKPYLPGALRYEGKDLGLSGLMEAVEANEKAWDEAVERVTLKLFPSKEEE